MKEANKIMTKFFYITKSISDGTDSVPTTDRFERMEKLNLLLSSGWKIKDFVSDKGEEYFVLEK